MYSKKNRKLFHEQKSKKVEYYAWRENANISTPVEKKLVLHIFALSAM